MNELEHLEEFEHILADYHMSDQAKQVLASTKLVLCNAVSASGRNTIIRELLKSNKYYFIVSDTTRLPRENDGKLEQNGVEYWFRTEDEMLADLRNGQFVEAAVIHHQQVSGMSIREVKRAHDQGLIGITDIEVAGVTNVIKEKPDAICLFVVPPTFDEWQRRLNERGSMSDKEKHRRLESAVRELEAALAQDYYYFVINDDLQAAVAQIDAIVDSPTASLAQEQADGRKVAQEILLQTRTLLGLH